MLQMLLATLLTPMLLGASGATSQPSSEFFPLMAWNNTPPDPAILQKMHDCGLNIAGFVAPETLDLCQDAGLKGIVVEDELWKHDWQKPNAEEIRRQVGNVVSKTNHHPAVFGYYLKDEPSADEFAGLAIAAQVVKELHPGAWPFIDLLPNGAFGNGQYPGYVEQFVKTCAPPILSYDHYALMEDGSLGGDYFENLQQMRAASLAAKVPFWPIIQTVGHIYFREPSAADLRFQVYASLAYGARGIAYFQYLCPKIGNYRMAPIDQFGHETRTWSDLRNVNLQIQKLAPTLLKLRSDAAYHTGHVPKGCAGLGDQSLVQKVDGDFVIGEFTHADGSRYLLAMNPNFKSSQAFNPTFRDPGIHPQMVSPYTGELIDYSGEQSWLAPGQGVLLKLGRSK
jgi:hypothetical protein